MRYSTPIPPVEPQRTPAEASPSIDYPKGTTRRLAGNDPLFARIRQEEAAHPIEHVGAGLRKSMPFLDPVKVVDGAVVKA